MKRCFALLLVAVLIFSGCSFTNKSADTTKEVEHQEIQQEDESSVVVDNTASEEEAKSVSVSESKTGNDDPFGENVQGESEEAEYETATVARIIDGDTIRVDKGEYQYSVRFILVNTPEMNAGGKTAKDFTANLLPVGATVYLEKDVSETDRYDRLLRYVWTEPPIKNPTVEDLKRGCVNAILLDKHYAEVAVYPPDVKYQAMFESIAGVTYDKLKESTDKSEKKAAFGRDENYPAYNGGASYVGNSNTMKFHRASCRHVKDIAPKHRVELNSREAGVSKGYKPCKRCTP